MAILDDLIAKFQQQQEAAREANERRYQEGLAIYDKIIKQYEPGGAFLQGVGTQLGREKTRTVARQTQDLVSSGLFGTSLTAGLGQKFEEEVAAPTRLRAEDIALERLAQAGVGKAGFIERREDIGPDYATIAQLAAQAANRPTTAYPSSLGNRPFAGASSGGGGRSLADWIYSEGARMQEQFNRQISRPMSSTGAGDRGVSYGKPSPSGFSPTDYGQFTSIPTSPTYGEPGGPAGPPAPTYGEPGGPAGPPAPTYAQSRTAGGGKFRWTGKTKKGPGGSTVYILRNPETGQTVTSRTSANY